MTEKRFTLNVDGETINDGNNRYCGEDVVELLNELHEENEELKIFLEALKEELSLANRDNDALEEENEQLKATIKLS